MRGHASRRVKVLSTTQACKDVRSRCSAPSGFLDGAGGIDGFVGFRGNGALIMLWLVLKDRRILPFAVRSWSRFFAIEIVPSPV